jgi:hypothetical protein
VSRLVDLSLELPAISFIEGSTIDATVRATAGREVMVEGGRVELVRTVTYRYTAWSPYASPIAVPARDAGVISQAHFHPASPLIDGQPLVQPVALDIPPEGPGSVQTDLVEIGWAAHARLHLAGSRDAEVTRPIVVLSQARDCAPVADTPPGARRSGVRRPRLRIAVEPPAGPRRPNVRRPDRGPATVGLGARHPRGVRAVGACPAWTAAYRRPRPEPGP